MQFSNNAPSHYPDPIAGIDPLKKTIAPFSPHTLYIGGKGNLFRSTDGGEASLRETQKGYVLVQWYRVKLIDNEGAICVPIFSSASAHRRLCFVPR